MTSAHERLSGAWNFRDVAEIAGVRPGRLFRSSELSSLDDAGRATMSALGVSDVADLRSPAEVARRGGGAVPNGVAVHNLPFAEMTHQHGVPETAQAPHEASFQKLLTEFSQEDPAVAAQRWMTAEYERFPTRVGALTAVRRIIGMLAEGRPVLVHCFAGKDRTGFAVATALEAAGVPAEAIMADYIRSNDAVGRMRASLLATIRSREDLAGEVRSYAESRLTDDVLGVREEYLAAARRARDETHGGLTGFLAAAEISGEEVARLRAQLLG